jgi:glycosyltransferase involved in cell wall biosynthesis
MKRLISELGIEEKVLFTGPLYGIDKIEAYIDADVYILPSVYETFPVSVIEACACGTPVIVTDRCGIANIIDGQVGLAVPYDEDALGKAILDILSDTNKKREYGINGKLLAREKLNWSKIVEQIEAVYINCLISNSPGFRKQI